MISPRRRPKLRLIDLGFVGVTAGFTGLGLWNYTSLQAPAAPPPKIYPTIIPWIQDQATCEKSDRAWQDQQCWDSQHDPNF